MSTGSASVGIGSVLEELSADFPDISISKIRYLEAQGLIEPDRTPKGFRRYSRSDVERLRFVLTAQRDRFWPLKVIREHLDALERGLVPSEDSATAVVPPSTTTTGERSDLAPRRPLRLTAEELATAAEVTDEIMRDLVSYGLLQPVDGHFGADDLEIATAAGRLVGSGVEVRHLRPFRTAAEREVGLVEHVRGAVRLHSRASRSDALDDDEVVAHVAGACLDLHTALVRAQIAHLRP